ncbi:MAG: peptidoglycan DD-metalloendopeptidase family protein [Myxococcaceae bacterium]
MSPGSRSGRLGALGWLLLAACASGRAGPPAGQPLPAWARPEAETHPEPEVVRGVHRVEKGETWFRIAKSYGLSAEELATANGRDPSAALAVGTELLIPGALEPATVSTAAAAAHPVAAASVASAWETPVEPLAGQALPPELLRAFHVGPPPPADVPLPDGLARAFDHPTAPMPRPAPPPPPAAPQAKSAAVAASIGPAPAGEGNGPRASAGRMALQSRSASATPVPGGLQWPLRGVLYARFGKKGREPHDGIDLAAPAGTSVRTAGEGVVLFAGAQSGYGLIVVVAHEKGLVTVYAHSRDLRVRTGQTVRAGQVIATVGESGKTSGPHLHFEVRVDGEPVDPLRFLGPVPAP